MNYDFIPSVRSHRQNITLAKQALQRFSHLRYTLTYWQLKAELLKEELALARELKLLSQA